MTKLKIYIITRLISVVACLASSSVALSSFFFFKQRMIQYSYDRLLLCLLESLGVSLTGCTLFSERLQ